MIGRLGFITGLVLLCAPVAAEPITSDTLTFSTMPVPKYYVWNPKPDITASELAQALVVLMPALACHQFNCPDIGPAIEALPPEVKRHFVHGGK